MTLAVKRWKFDDPYSSDAYTFEINPNQMSSLWPDRAVTSQVSTAPNGQILMFEGATPSKQWTFGGTLLTKTQYDALVLWCYKRTRMYIYDHFGRRITCVITGLDMQPKRTQRHYWRHDYTVQAQVIAVGAPTVNEYWS